MLESAVFLVAVHTVGTALGLLLGLTLWVRWRR